MTVTGAPGAAAGAPIARSMLVMTIAVIVALAALFSTIGADAQWLAALGRAIVARHSIPSGIPFAGAPSSRWANVPVLAEVVFDGLERGLGDRGLMLAQLLAVGFALAVLARDAREGGASVDGTSNALLLAAVGALPSLVIVRVQLFSLALFPVLLALLRRESRAPSKRIWLVVGLLALWGNLHGAALVGLAVAFVYLLLGRLRDDPRTAVGVMVASVLALCVTPALADTVTYYRDLVNNVSAQRHSGLWAPLSLGAPLDDLAIVAALALAWRVRRSRLRAWEVAVLILLAGLSVRADRSLVWLLFCLVAPAARSMRPRRAWRRRLLPPIALLACAIAVYALARGPIAGTDRAFASRAVALARGTPVLAPDRLAEQIALDGGRIWLGDPIDAFSASDQAAYLDWMRGKRAGLAAVRPAIEVVLAGRGTPTARLMMAATGFVVIARDRTTVLYVRAARTR
jgi:hypothetical protein